MLLEKKKEEMVSVHIPKICRDKLEGYALSLKELSESIQSECLYGGNDRQELLLAEKYRESTQILCGNLEDISRLLENAAKDVFSYIPLEDKKRKNIIHILKDEGILVTDICFIPSEDRMALSVSMYTDRKELYNAKDVASMLSVLFRLPLELSVTSPCSIDRICKNYLFVQKADFFALTGYAKATKENESISGDSYSFLESEQGKVIMLLSDGTGSGKDACKNSERTLDLAERMLEAGYETETVIHLLNSALVVSGENQNYPTLDICEVNLYEGSCCFYKVGGAPSFIKGEKGVEILQAGSLPLGVFKEPVLKKEKRMLQSGDFVLMMSDGVLEAFGDWEYEEAVRKLLNSWQEENPGTLAEKILQTAIKKSEGRIRDDMTVLVVGIWENNRA